MLVGKFVKSTVALAAFLLGALQQGQYALLKTADKTNTQRIARIFDRSLQILGVGQPALAFGKAARDRLCRDNASIKKYRAIALVTVKGHAVCPHCSRWVRFQFSGCTEHGHDLVPIG